MSIVTCSQCGNVISPEEAKQAGAGRCASCRSVGVQLEQIIDVMRSAKDGAHVENEAAVESFPTWLALVLAAMGMAVLGLCIAMFFNAATGLWVFGSVFIAGLVVWRRKRSTRGVGGTRGPPRSAGASVLAAVRAIAVWPRSAYRAVFNRTAPAESSAGDSLATVLILGCVAMLLCAALGKHFGRMIATRDALHGREFIRSEGGFDYYRVWEKHPSSSEFDRALKAGESFGQKAGFVVGIVCILFFLGMSLNGDEPLAAALGVVIVLAVLYCITVVPQMLRAT